MLLLRADLKGILLNYVPLSLLAIKGVSAANRQKRSRAQAQ